LSLATQSPVSGLCRDKHIIHIELPHSLRSCTWLVLSLEDLERRALSLPEEDRSLMLAQRDEICSEMFSLLKLKTLDQQWNKYKSVCVCYSLPVALPLSFNPPSTFPQLSLLIPALLHPSFLPFPQPSPPGEMNRYSNM